MKEATATQRPARPPGRNEPCWCGSGRKYKKCHLPSDREVKAGTMSSPGRIKAPRKPPLIKTQEQIEGIRRACRLAYGMLDDLAGWVAAGVTTGEIDAWVVERTAAAGAVAATLNYKGFPKSCCTSINEVVCHGIPEARALENGDIVNIDVTPILDGFYGDTSRMFLIGEVAPEAKRLVEVTRECLEFGVAAVRPGATVGDLGAAIQSHAEGAGFSVVRSFGGHGVGLAFHEDPHIAHYGRAGTGHPLVPGMVFTIEPMINAGGWQVEILDDGWTAVTVDGGLSAQFEHTVAVTEDGVDILTA